MQTMEDLDAYRVGNLPTIFYIPNYVSPKEQLQLLHQVNAAPASRWKALKNRRLQNWGGVVHEKGLLPQKLPPWLLVLTEKICHDFDLFPSPINHVLINEYGPGQGIMPHQDGPAYFPVVAIVSLGSPAVMQFTPHQRIIELSNINEDPSLKHDAPLSPKPVSIVLMPGSLLLFKDSAYEEYLHGIDDCMEHTLDDTVVNLDKLDLNSVELDTKEVEDETKVQHTLKREGLRISLTCRLVTRVYKNLIKL